MSTKRVMDFFKNKVTIRLKNGHQFRGLLSQVDYKANVIVLEDIEDLGNLYDKEQLPLDKKIPDKAFEAENIEEILLADKLFAEPKKYQKDDFFDSMTEHKEERGYRGDREDRGEYKPRRGRGGRGGSRGGSNRNENRDEYKGDRGDNRGGNRGEYKGDRPRKNYEEKRSRDNEDNERDYR